MTRYLEKNVVVGPFQCNCRILVCPVTGEAAAIDPGDEPGKVLAALAQAKWTNAEGVAVEPRLKYLLHTHAHLDHIGGTRAVREATEKRGGGKATIALHQDDVAIYDKLQDQGRMFGLRYDEPLPVEKFLEHGEEISLGSLKLSVIHTPGHSPGGVCLRLHEDSALSVPETVFTGDTLFQGSVGRTDLWGADADQMFRSIRERILVLDGDTRVCPGHGGESKVGIEKHSNPFL